MKRGETNEYFHNRGKYPEVKDFLNKIKSGYAKTVAHCFNKMGWIPSGPGDELISRFFSSSRTRSYVIAGNYITELAIW